MSNLNIYSYALETLACVSVYTTSNLIMDAKLKRDGYKYEKLSTKKKITLGLLTPLLLLTPVLNFGMAFYSVDWALFRYKEHVNNGIEFGGIVPIEKKKTRKG